MRRVIWGKGVVLMVVMATLSACSNLYLLSSEYVASSQGDSAPDVVMTDVYKREGRAITSLALRAPETCYARGAADVSAPLAKDDPRAICAVEMAEVERNLAKAGYRVISWKILAREMEATNRSVTAAAASLDAEAVLQINSIDKTIKVIGRDARWERKYYKSNAGGEKLQEQAFDEATRTYFKEKFLEPRELDLNLRRLAVTIDANAVLINTNIGESFWYYRWTHVDPVDGSQRREVLVNCGGSNRECASVTPAGGGRGALSAGDSEAVSITESADDIKRATYARLTSTVIENMARSFAGR